MARFAPNKMPLEVKLRYFEMLREGHSGAEAARRVGVSVSCGSLWFIDAGSVTVLERVPISSRFFNQDDRIEIADGLAAGEAIKSIAARIGKSFRSVYREIARNRRPDGTYQPWSLTTRRIFVAAGRRPGASPPTPGCEQWWRSSSACDGRRSRSAGGRGGVTRGPGPGMCAPRRSTTLSTVVSSSLPGLDPPHRADLPPSPRPRQVQGTGP